MYQIRPYQEKDREQVRHIFRETAWDSYKTDPEKLECVPIIYCDYFIEQEPQYCFVVVNEADVPVGAVVCSADYEKFCQMMPTVYADQVREHRPEEVSLITGFLPCLEKVKEHPAHYHINFLPEGRRQGFGRKLLDTLCARLKQDGYESLTGCCARRGSDGYKMYMKCGFVEIYDYGNDVVSINRRFS